MRLSCGTISLFNAHPAPGPWYKPGYRAHHHAIQSHPKTGSDVTCQKEALFCFSEGKILFKVVSIFVLRLRVF